MPRSRPGCPRRRAVELTVPAAGPVEPGHEAQQGRLPAARRPQDRQEVVLLHDEVGRGQGRDERTARSLEAAGHAANDELGQRFAHTTVQANSLRFSALNSRSETRPMTPMVMMPKIILPVASSAWLSMIMWPIPDSEPISSATIT